MRKRAIEKLAMRIAMLSPRRRTDGVMTGLLLTLTFWGSFLLQCGDVEQNPGPKAPRASDSFRQTRLTSASARRTSTDTGSGQDSRQTSPPPSSQQPTMADLMERMDSLTSTMNCKFDGVERAIRDLTDQCTSLQSGVRELVEEVGILRKENQDLKRTNSELMAKVEVLEKKTDDLEGRSKRNNLIFYGIARGKNETNDQCEGKVRDLLIDRLDFTTDVEFDRVHRLSAKPDSPIVARCCFYRDKIMILKAKQKLKGSSVFIGEDFTSRVREIRQKLTPHLKNARQNGRRAAMVFDHLLIDGKKFYLHDFDQTE